MTEIELIIPIKAFSINKLYYRDGKVKTTDARNWEHTVIEYLRDCETQEKLTQFRDSFDPSKHCLHIDLTFEYPQNQLYTKEGKLSSRAYDLSNVEKPLIDVIFIKDYSTKRIRNLEIDDKYLTKMSSEKIQGEKHRMIIKVYIKDL